MAYFFLTTPHCLLRSAPYLCRSFRHDFRNVARAFHAVAVQVSLHVPGARVAERELKRARPNAARVRGGRAGVAKVVNDDPAIAAGNAGIEAALL